MAGKLPRKVEDFKKIPKAKIAILASMWHSEYVDPMIERTITELIACEVSSEDIQTHKVPGTFELPYAARIILEKQKDLDAIITFGIVLQGDTVHNTSILEHVIHGFGLLVDKFSKPIINEVIGVSNLKDAERRSGNDEKNKGVEAAFAATEIINWHRNLKIN